MYIHTCNSCNAYDDTFMDASSIIPSLIYQQFACCPELHAAESCSVTFGLASVVKSPMEISRLGEWSLL